LTIFVSKNNSNEVGGSILPISQTDNLTSVIKFQKYP
jgi:hypothetical protein